MRLFRTCPFDMLVAGVAGVEDYIVAFAVSVGAGDAEAEVGGFEGEGEFGEFSAALGGEFVLARGLGGRLYFDRILLNRLRARRWSASARRAGLGHVWEKRKGAGCWPAPQYLLSISRIAFWAGQSGHCSFFILSAFAMN